MNVLAVGTNPQVVYYSWRLLETNLVLLAQTNILPLAPIHVNLSYKGLQPLFHPQAIYPTLDDIPRGSQYDVVVLAASSLQDFQLKCEKLVPLVDDHSIIVIELTGYINLEPFVLLLFPKNKKVGVVLIMNEADVRLIGTNEYAHVNRTSDPRIYIGLTQSQQAYLKDDPKFVSVCKSLGDGTKQAFLTLFQPKEFMTYQWKLALPRIVFNPLQIIFEAPFPSQLSLQILCKPLISGIINELFKIIKKMDCKLVKGFENEQNLMKSWLAAFPETRDDGDYRHSPSLFYDFFHGYSLELDLLLLQPILLADDHGIKSPYLENLYLTLCQYDTVNRGQLILLERKLAGNSAALKSQLADLDAEVQRRQQELSQLERQLTDKTKHHQWLQQDIQDLSRKLTEMETVKTPGLGEEFKGLAIVDGEKSHGHVLEKELELQQREQELLNREQLLAAQLPSQAMPSPGQFGAIDPYRNGMASPPKPNLFAESMARPANSHSQPPVGSRVPSNNSLPGQPQPQQPGLARRVPLMPQINVNTMNQYEHSNHPSFNNAAPIDPLVELRFKQAPKKGYRRLALPPMTGNLDGFDVGGRGGMPMPGKYRALMGPGMNRPQQYGHMSVTNHNNITKIMPQQNPQQPVFSSPPQPQPPALVAPVNGNFLGLSADSFGLPLQDDQVVNNHSYNDVDARPLGAGLGGSGEPEKEKKKKKKGLFGKKKK